MLSFVYFTQFVIANCLFMFSVGKHTCKAISAIAKLTKAILPRCSFHFAKLLFFLKTTKFPPIFLFAIARNVGRTKKSRRFYATCGTRIKICLNVFLYQWKGASSCRFPESKQEASRIQCDTPIFLHIFRKVYEVGILEAAHLYFQELQSPPSV